MARPDHPLNSPNFFSKTSQPINSARKPRTLASVLQKKNASNHTEALESSLKKSKLQKPTNVQTLKNDKSGDLNVEQKLVKGKYYEQTLKMQNQPNKEIIKKNITGDTGSSDMKTKMNATSKIPTTKVAVKRTKLNLFEEKNDINSRTMTPKKTIGSKHFTTTPKNEQLESKLKNST